MTSRACGLSQCSLRHSFDPGPFLRHIRRNLRSTLVSRSITRTNLKPQGLPSIFVRPTLGSVGTFFCKRNLVFALRGACQYLILLGSIKSARVIGKDRNQHHVTLDRTIENEVLSALIDHIFAARRTRKLRRCGGPRRGLGRETDS